MAIIHATISQLHRPARLLLSCVIWILGAFLVCSAIDAAPDPPALNPGVASACKVLSQHSSWRAPSTLRCDAVVAHQPIPVRFVAVAAVQPSPSTAPMVRAGYAADSSPPAL